MLTGIPLLLLLAVVIVGIVLLGSKVKLHPFFVLLLAAICTAVASGMPATEIAPLAAEGFGSMMKKIGIVVIIGTCIGTILEKSGAIIVIANAILKLFGLNQSIAAVTLIGALVGIPIFCDSGFVILSGINKPLAEKSKKKYTALVCAMASGLYVTHTLLPPHPGSIAGAANLGLKDHIGSVIITGFCISIPVTIVAWLFSNFYVPKIASANPINIAHNNSTSTATTVPALYACILPIVVPVVLIAVQGFSVFFTIPATYKIIIDIVGNPIMALLIGLIIAVFLLVKTKAQILNQWIKEAITHAGSILIVVGAGGIFGEVLKHTNLADIAKSILQNNTQQTLLFLFFAWCMGVLLKTAQGSTTAAIIVVTSIVAPLASNAGFESSTALSLLLAAIAGGTMMISHSNDAYFWVITQFSGISMAETYKSFSVATICMSITTLLTVLFAAAIFL